MSRSSSNVSMIDALGRIVVPKMLRDKYQLPYGTKMNFEITEQGILMEVYSRPDECMVCNGQQNLINVHGRYLCKTCLEEAKKEKPIYKGV